MKVKNVNYRLAIACFFGFISIVVNPASVQAEDLPDVDTLLLDEINVDSRFHGHEILDSRFPSNNIPIINDNPEAYENLSPDNLAQHNHNYNNNNNYDDYDDDAPNFEPPEDWPEPINDSKTYSLFLVEKLEYRGQDTEDLFNWEIFSWVGGDYDRLWIKSEGDVGLENGDGEAEVQLLYGKLVSPFWDFQAGVRYDQSFGAEDNQGRAFGVIGIQGLAPYLFEIDAAMFVSEDGDVSARFVTEYQLLLSQRLILQPELETNVAVQTVEEFGVGAGINDIDLGVRLRYEFSRQFAPYVGVNWSRKFGETADLARDEGESVDDVSVVGGMRLMF